MIICQQQREKWIEADGVKYIGMVIDSSPNRSHVVGL